jgi:hypothetical protein
MKHVQVFGAVWDWIAGIVERIIVAAHIKAILLMALTSVDSHPHYTKIRQGWQFAWWCKQKNKRGKHLNQSLPSVSKPLKGVP